MDNFTCLDELTQVIYQSVYKFVVLSAVNDDKWDIHLGLSGSQGRWWHGCWTKEDIHGIFGPKASSKILEAFAEKLAEMIIQGEICVTDWSTEKGAKIKFTLGPAATKPMHVSLVEMSPEDAAAHATRVFTEIALQAQSRKCRLYPTSVDYQPEPIASTSTFSRPSRRELPAERERKRSSPKPHSRSDSHPQPVARSQKDVNPEIKANQEEIKALKTQLSELKNTKRNASPIEKPVPAVRAPKGASLANPNKKARKQQVIEFASDDE